MTTSKFISKITVLDPDTQKNVEVSIYKEQESGVMFGIDSYYVLFIKHEAEGIEIPSLYSHGATELIN